ncbi:MAG: carbohydrate deacetylase [Cyclobacteriaceae bacterium]|nr:MAG: carbohydrate deacetylase [Cyclobacteriaceae bacterium]
MVEQLGYSTDTKLLILHADDLGVAHSENQATFDAFELGMVNSASVMVPCPWFNEVVQWHKSNPETDLGLHLTLTSEWDILKWGPVAPVHQVPGLVNEQGYFYDNVADVISHASVEEVETELRAQIERSLAAGLEPTHLDSHMGSLFNEKFFRVYLKLGREYQVPLMLSNNVLNMFPGEKPSVPEDVLLVDQVYMAFPENYQAGMKEFYSDVLTSLSPGVSVLLIHPAYDNQEMQAVTINHPNYGASWRQQDFDFFTSDLCRKIIEENNIKLVTWKEIGKLLN